MFGLASIKVFSMKRVLGSSTEHKKYKDRVNLVTKKESFFKLAS